MAYLPAPTTVNLSSALHLKYSNIESSLVEMLFLDISPANFTNFGAAWTEVDSGTNVNVDGSGILTLNGSGVFNANGLYHTAGLTRAGGCLEFQTLMPANAVNQLHVNFNISAALAATLYPPFRISALAANQTISVAAISTATPIVAVTWYTIRIYIQASSDATWGFYKVTIQGGIFTTETLIGQADKITPQIVDPFYVGFQRFTNSGTNLANVKLPKWFSGYSAAAPYVEYIYDAGAGKVFDNFDMTALVLPGTVATTNLTYAYYFGADSGGAYSAAQTLANFNANGKITGQYRYIKIRVYHNSDGPTQVYSDKLNAATATDGVGQFPAVGDVIQGAQVQLVNGTTANLTAADTKYLSLEAGRNENITGVVAGDLLVDEQFKVKGTTITGKLCILTYVTPVRVPTAGGTLIQLTGIGMSHVTAVRIGGPAGALCTDISYSGDTDMTCKTPAGQSGELRLWLTLDTGYSFYAQGIYISFDDQVLTLLQEQARNTPLAAEYESGKHFLKLNVDTVGTFAGGGSVPAPAVPALGTPVALSPTSLRAYFTWAADAEKIYLSIAPALTGVYGAEIQMAAGVYQYDFTGLTAGTAYFIRARAWNTTAYSAYATAVTGTTRTTTGIEQALWDTFKTKMAADAYLAAYIVKWKFNREANILAESKFPVLKAWIVDTSEDWKGVPKSKIVRCRVIIHGIVKVKDSTNLETEKLKFDEYVKNALEADMTFDGGVTMNIVGDTIFSNLDDSTAEIAMQCEILSNRFTAGER